MCICRSLSVSVFSFPSIVLFLIPLLSCLLSFVLLFCSATTSVYLFCHFFSFILFLSIVCLLSLSLPRIFFLALFCLSLSLSLFTYSPFSFLAVFLSLLNLFFLHSSSFYCIHPPFYLSNIYTLALPCVCLLCVPLSYSCVTYSHFLFVTCCLLSSL